jgi:class 3 adenylate cyclase
MPGLPTGAVTFLFTDIEGSTRLVRQLRAGYSEVLTEHQRLLREAFARRAGYEIDTQGDAFFYAFASAHEAVLGAIAGQRALAAHAWPADASVRVRMGIHTGLATPTDGRYTGLAVHRAARICAAAHGGQVLVSQATQSLLEDEEEELALRLKDLGEQRLKDIVRPVRLYQVAAEGLAEQFPPLQGDEEKPAEIVAPDRSIAGGSRWGQSPRCWPCSRASSRSSSCGAPRVGCPKRARTTWASSTSERTRSSA